MPSPINPLASFGAATLNNAVAQTQSKPAMSLKSTADPARAYFALVAQNAAGRPEVAAFVEWLKAEAAKR